MKSKTDTVTDFMELRAYRGKKIIIKTNFFYGLLTRGWVQGHVIYLHFIKGSAALWWFITYDNPTVIMEITDQRQCSQGSESHLAFSEGTRVARTESR